MIQLQKTILWVIRHSSAIHPKEQDTSGSECSTQTLTPETLQVRQVLPKPDMEGKKRRGGKRFRKMKERYGLTDTRKAANRVNFNQAEEEFLDGDEVRMRYVQYISVRDKDKSSGMRRLRRTSWTTTRFHCF